MANAFLQPTLDLLDKLISSGVVSMSSLEAVEKSLKAVPELQGSCGCCLREQDHQDEDGYVHGTDAIAVVHCANECRGCDQCVKPCCEGTCCRNFCSDCLQTCEGCGDKFCQQHAIEDPDCAAVWCKDCLPADKRRKMGREAAHIGA